MGKTMRAKMSVTSVKRYDFDGKPEDSYEEVEFMAVCSDETFGKNGESENNTFARWTPSADLNMTITNPSLLGKLKEGDEYYLDFTPANKN